MADGAARAPPRPPARLQPRSDADGGVADDDDANPAEVTAAEGQGGTKANSLLHMDRYDPLRPLRSSFVQHSIAGAAGGLVSSFVTCPLDVAKTRLQYLGASSQRYRGPIQTLHQIYLDEGVRGWYRGLAPTLVGYLPTWAIYFVAYERFKVGYRQFLGPASSDLTVNMLGAVSAGAVSSVCTNPLWVIKTRIMTQSVSSAYHYRGIMDAFLSILRHDGWRGLYRGLGSSFIGLSHVAVQFPLYESLKKALLRFERRNRGDPELDQLSPLYILTASSVSKICASACTYPHEVVRTRLHTNPVLTDNGIVRTVRLVLHEEGARGFYRGLAANLLRVVPAAATTLLTYELVSRTLNNALKPVNAPAELVAEHTIPPDPATHAPATNV